MMSSAEVHRSDTMRSNFSTGSRQSSVRDARPQSNGHSMSNGQIGIVREAAQMVEILKREAVFLTGGRDRRGGPVLTFPASNDSGQVSYEDLATALIYLCSLPSTESAKLGFTVLFDNREHHYKEVKPLLKLLQDALGSSVFAVYIVQPEKGKLNFSFRRERNLSIEPQNITVAKLKNIIQPNQLSIELGGSLDYKHALWLERRLGLEKFVKEAKNVAMELERTFIQITDRLSRDEKITPQELLRQHQSLQESVIYIPERTIQHGRQLYQDWEDDAVAAGLQVANIERVDFAGPHFTLDQVAAMNHIKKLVEGLEGQLERIQDLWRDRHVQLGDKLQLSEMEQAMRTVVDWILGPAEKLLSSQTDIGTTYETADELRKQHEQLELKCTDSYGTYAELRHKSVDAIEQQPEKAADIEAQRDYMDTVCRSFAARLQRRRNLIITSVRFHRLVNEINQLLDDFFKWLSIDMECEDIKAVEEMLMALNEKCDELIAVCEQAVNEGQNLLDQLSLPVKNAFGQDVSPDNSKHTEHVEMLLGRLQARRGEAEEFAQVRRLKLQQLQQLKKCEGDAEQAITWILELYSAAVQKMSEGTGDPITEQAIQADLRELQDTAKNTYEYGKQLLQAALHLRRSLRYDLSPNNDQAQRLADAWKQFSLGVQERASRLDTQTDFHRRADQVLEDIDRLLVVISQVMNSEITVESLVISHSQLRSSVDNEYELTTAMGQELLHRLQKPMLSQRGQRQMEMEDPYVAAQVENKLKELEAKYKLMHENWLEMTQGLQLARDGTLLGPDRRPWQQQMNQVIEETVTMTTYGSHLQSAPPIERGGSEWERLLQQLRESHDWIRVRIQQMEPDLLDVGSSLEEARSLRREHDELLTKLEAKQKDVTELLAKADDMAAQNRPYPEVYAAMAESLGQTWKDLNTQLEYRKMLLDQSIAFHESAAQFSQNMTTAQADFTSSSLANDLDHARHMLQQHQDLKKDILESSMQTLQEGQSLLDRIRQMAMHADVQNRHATTAACYGIEHLLELLQDKRRQLEDLWLQRKIRLEHCLQLLLLDKEVDKVFDWFQKVGNTYLSNKDLGDSLSAAQQLQDQHLRFEEQAREIQDTVLRLLRTADQVVHSAHSNAEGVKQRLLKIDTQCEDFMLRLEKRRKNLTLAVNFFSLAKTALSKLSDIEVQLTSSDLPRNSQALAERHAYLSAAIADVTTPVLREGLILLERVGREGPGVQGVVAKMDELQNRSATLEEMCKARYEASERSQAYHDCQDRFNALNSWLHQIGLAYLGQYRDMGTNLSSARDFLEIHERLDEDIRDKSAEVEALCRTADTLAAEAGEEEGAAVQQNAQSLRQQWDLLQTTVEQRIHLALSYTAFHKKAQNVALQMDALEQYLKIEKLDASQVSENTIQHKETKYNEMNSHLDELQVKGKGFIQEASGVKEDTSLDTRRAIGVVETIMSQFVERKYVVTDYYEHWKVHVTVGKEFKTEWLQFIQDARKTIDWVMRIEDEFFPVVAGELGSSEASCKEHAAKLKEFLPTFKKAQEEMEKHLKTAELLSLKGDTKGQHEQIVNELLRVHTRFQARIAEYQILINMSLKFFQNLQQLDQLIETTEREYQLSELPTDVTKAEMQLREHVAAKDKMEKMIDFSHEEGEQIVTRVRQQDSEAIAKDEVQKVLQLTEGRRSNWEKTWEDQKARLEANLQLCQFYAELRQLHGEMDELQRQVQQRQGQYGSSLSSCKLTLQAFTQFENSLQGIENKVRGFSSTADKMIREEHFDSRRIKHEIQEVERKWDDFCNSIKLYRTALDDSTKFFEIMDECEGWVNESSQFLLQVGRRATDCKTSTDAQNLIDQLDTFKKDNAAKQDARLGDMQKISVELYGPVAGPQKMQHVVDHNQELLSSFYKAMEELAILRDNLLKKEQILADMEAVVEAKTPRHPRFVVGLQNAELTEGQKFTFECRLECDTPNPKIEWFKDNLPMNSPDYETTYRDGLCQLTIEETFSEDTAKYTCKATTEQGEAETSGNLRVKAVKKPSFLEPLHNVSTKEGQKVTLAANFSGEPAPQIQWVKNDTIIMPSAIYKVTIESTRTVLEIREIFPEDSGTYTVLARNLGGEARTSCLVQVDGIRPSQAAPVASAPMRPRFTQPLKNQDVVEGNRARLDTVIIGRPEPEIVWYHNERPVKESRDFQLLFEGDRCSLIIREVYLEDSGEYKVTARNSLGVTDSRCRLNIEPLSELSDASMGSAPGDAVPPKFTQLLKDIDANEGQTVRFDARVIGHPAPTIKWFRGRQQIQPSTDFQINTERELCMLTIPEVFKEDAGNFMVKATNQAGTAKCYASLIVKVSSDKHVMKTRLVESSHTYARETTPGHKAPEFLKLFNDARVLPGQPFKFEITITGFPRPSVQWLFNNEPIVSPDYQISNAGDRHFLYIPEVFDEDAGRFTVVAENDSGKATCSSLLVVVEEAHMLPSDGSPPETPVGKDPSFNPFAPATRPQAAKPQEQIKPVAMAPVAQAPPPPPPVVQPPRPAFQAPIRQTPPPPPKQMSPFPKTDLTVEMPVPPQFAEQLKTMAAEEGTRVTFEGSVKGKPEPTIKWFKEGKEITDSPDFQISYNNNRVSLMIPEVFEEDAGRYVCKAENKAGSQQSSAELIVKASMLAPEFVERLTTKEVKEGAAVKFSVKVKGKPPPEVTWYREGSQIVSSPDFEIKQQGDIYSLSIPEVFYEDSGKFTVQLDNRAGHTSCTAELIVEAPSAHEESVSPSPPVSRSPSMGMSPDRAALYTPQQTLPMAPKKPVQFTRPLSNQKAKEGQRVTLQCSVPAYPAPEKVQWFRNEIEIHPSTDYQISNNNGNCCLTIVEVFPEDEGKYVCTVYVQGMHNSTFMYLTVEPPVPVKKVPESAPVFDVQLAPQPLHRGQTAYFECQVSGYPPPEILWTRRGHPLVDKARYKSTYDQYTGTTTLTILNLCPEDEGEYTCTAINSKGEISTSAMLMTAEHYRDWERDANANMERNLLRDTVHAQSPRYKSPTPTYYKPEEPKRETPVSPSFKVSTSEMRLQKEVDYRDNLTSDDEAFGVSKDDTKTPVFSQKPKNFQLMDGADATFVCKVEGNPRPNIQWFHDGRMIRPSQRYEMKLTRDGYVSLRILNAYADDAGHYTCCATNVVGRDACSAELFQDGVNVIDETSYIDPDVLRRMQASPRDRRDHEPGGVSEKYFKPVFRKVPVDQDVTEGSMCRFDCIVTGRPNPELLWYREGVQVFEDSLHKIVINEDGINSLIFDATHKKDAGLYTCIARNRGGEDRFQVRLNVAPRPINAPPRFLDRLQNKTVREGEPVSFECEAVGVPTPMMGWQKDGKMLNDSAFHRIQTDTGKSSLTIDSARPDDSAWFQCIAANVAGTATNRAKLIVQVEPKRPEPERRFSIPRKTITTPIESPVTIRGTAQWHSPVLCKESSPTSFNSSLARKPPAGSSPLLSCKASSPAAFASPSSWSMPSSPASSPLMLRKDSRTRELQSPSFPMMKRPASEPRRVSLTTPEPDIRSTSPIDLHKFMAPKALQSGPPAPAPPPATPPSHLSRADILLSPTPPATPSPVPWGHVQAPPAGQQPSAASPMQQPPWMTEPPKPAAPVQQPQRFPSPSPKPIQQVSFTPPPTRQQAPSPITIKSISLAKPTPPSPVPAAPKTPTFDREPGDLYRFDSDLIPEITSDLESDFNEIVDVNEEVLDPSLDENPPQRSPQDNLVLKVTLSDYNLGPNSVESPMDFDSSHEITDDCVFPLKSSPPSLSFPDLPSETKDEVEEEMLLPSVYKPASLTPFPSDESIPAKPQLPARKEITATFDFLLHSLDLKSDESVDGSEVDEDPVVPSKHERDIVFNSFDDERPVEPKRSSTSYQPPIEDMFSKEKPIPPKFKSPLKALNNLVEGQPAHFETYLVPIGDPDLEVEWYKDGQVLRAGHKFKQTHEFGHVALDILYTYPEDSGTYNVKAKNKHGVDSIQTTIYCSPKDKVVYESQLPDDGVTVKKLHAMEDAGRDMPDYCADRDEPVHSGIGAEPPIEDMYNKENPRPPKFKTQIQPLPKKVEGQSSHFECRLVPVGDPNMEVEWYKDGVLLRSGHKFKPLYDFGFVALDILYTYPEDSGTYTAKATNKLGSDTTQTVLHCTGKDSVIYETQLPEGSHGVQKLQAMEDNIRRDLIPKERKEDEQEGCAPVFDLMPEPCTVEEADTAKFMVKLSGHPRPRLTWWINGAIVVSSMRFRLRYDGMIHILEIPKVRDYDGGTVRVVAKNPLGEAECSTSLTVIPREDWRSRLKQAPLSTAEVELHKKRPIERRTMELQSALMKPKTTVVELRAFERSTQEKALAYKDEEVQQAFMDINMQHAKMNKAKPGYYESTAHVDSEVHIARAKAMLNMVDAPQHDDKQRNISQSQIQRKEPPTFTKPLVNISAKEGQAVKLEVHFTGFPTAEIQWFREGVEIQPSRDFQVTNLYQKSFLLIPEVFPEDAGMITVRAINPFGMAECRGMLTVAEDATKPKETPPEFHVQMRDLSINIGEPATFDCQVSGYPRPDVYWCKDGKRLGDNPRWKYFYEEDHYTLLIYEIRPEDAGVFECVVMNKNGKATCSARLSTSGQPEEKRSTAPMVSQAAPQLQEPMRDQHINEGDSVTFQCKILASPDPIITWYYNNQVIKPSKYFQMHSQNGIHQLTIAGAFPEDDGTYKCIARNQAGEVTCIAHLKVSPLTSEPEPDMVKVMEPPRYLKPITGLDVVEGKSAQFEAIVAGQPPPEVTWFREGHQITDSQEFKITREGNKSVLVIKEVFPEDSGIFTCRATNPAGVAECSAELFVEGELKEESTSVETKTTRKVETSKLQIQVTKVQESEQPTESIEASFELEKPEVQVTEDVVDLTLEKKVTTEVSEEATIKGTRTTRVLTIPKETTWPSDDPPPDINANTHPSIMVGPLYADKTDAINPTQSTEDFLSQKPQHVDAENIATHPMVEGFSQELAVRNEPSDLAIHPQMMLSKEDQEHIQMALQQEVDKTIHSHEMEINDEITVETKVMEVKTVKMELSESGNVSLMETTEVKTDTELSESRKRREKDQVVMWKKTYDPKPIKHSLDDSLERPAISPAPLGFDNDIPSVENIPDFMRDMLVYVAISSYEPESDEVMSLHEGEKLELLEDPAREEWWLVRKLFNNRQGWVPGQYLKDKADYDQLVDQQLNQQIEQLQFEDAADEFQGKPHPPVIVQGLNDLKIRDGDSATLECRVEGNPEPSVVWFREASLIQATPDFMQFHEGDTYTLSIREVFPEDTGRYTMVAKNPYGTATCSTEIMVEENTQFQNNALAAAGVEEDKDDRMAPRIVKKPKAQVVDEGQTVTFECKLTSKPQPTIVWYKDEVTIAPEANRFTVDTQQDVDAYITILTISDVEVSDAGKYKIVATNEVGEVTMSVSLVVQEVKKTVDLRESLKKKEKPTKKPEPEKEEEQSAFFGSLRKVSASKEEETPKLEKTDFRNLLQKTEKPKSGSQASTDQQDFRSLLSKSPSVTKDCSDAGVVKYQKVEQKDFREVLGKSTDKNPEFPPTKNMTKDETKVFKERRVSQQPKILSEADLHELQAPVVVDKPHDVTVKEGESARFTCRLLGMPTPSIAWFFMGKPIVEDDIYKLDEMDGGHYSLCLPECFPEDAGVYTIRGTNAHGIVEATCFLNVEEVLSEESVSETLQTKEEEETEATFTLTQQEEPKEEEDAPKEVHGVFNPADLWSLCTMAHVTKPVITQVLTETIGGAVKVDLSAKELSDAERKIMRAQTNHVKLLSTPQQINLSILLENLRQPLPQRSEALLFVNEPVGEAPRFKRGLTALNVNLENPIKLECQLEEAPQPEITWYKDGLELVDDRYIVEINEDLEVTLTICEGTVDDSGEYTIRAKNDFGETSDSIQVTVIYEPPTFDQPLSDLTILIGDNTTFKCTFHGKPQPKTKWLISGNEIIECDKYHIVSEQNTSTLEVINVTKEDVEQEFTCQIFSPVGEESCSAHLLAQGLLLLLLSAYSSQVLLPIVHRFLSSRLIDLTILVTC